MNTKKTCQCDTCESDDPTATRVCGKCGILVCEECFYECERCKAICCCGCCDHRPSCGGGDTMLCDDCRLACAGCGADLADESKRHRCARCEATVCADCAADCARCGGEFCLECLDPCETCDAHLCRDHRNYCDGCGDIACPRCLTTAPDEKEYCPDCLPKHTGMQASRPMTIRIFIDDNGYHESRITTMPQMRCDLSYMLSKYLGTDVEPGEGDRWTMLDVLSGTLIGRAIEDGLLDGIETNPSGIPVSMRIEQ